MQKFSHCWCAMCGRVSILKVEVPSLEGPHNARGPYNLPRHMVLHVTRPKLSHFKSWWHEKSFVCWTWTNRNLLKCSGVPIGTCHQMVGKASHVCIWCHHANRVLGKGGMSLQLRSDPLLWNHGQKRVVNDEVSCLIFRVIISLVRKYLQTWKIHGLNIISSTRSVAAKAIWVVIVYVSFGIAIWWSTIPTTNGRTDQLTQPSRIRQSRIWCFPRSLSVPQESQTQF